ncbi:MAG: hypothetical protein OEQ47_02990, partial [Acidimicrobiia bacterium]|nr:hypothetical protein [Acidimicrobiia bacterium]
MTAAPDLGPDDIGFSTALRGFNKDEVIAYITDLSTKLEAAMAQREWDEAEKVDTGEGDEATTGPAPTMDLGMAAVLDSK